MAGKRTFVISSKQDDIASMHRRNRERERAVIGGQLLDGLDHLMNGFNTQDPSPDDLLEFF